MKIEGSTSFIIYSTYKLTYKLTLPTAKRQLYLCFRSRQHIKAVEITLYSGKSCVQRTVVLTARRG